MVKTYLPDRMKTPDRKSKRATNQDSRVPDRGQNAPNVEEDAIQRNPGYSVLSVETADPIRHKTAGKISD